MSNSKYQIVFIGAQSRRAAIETAVRKRTSELGILRNQIVCLGEDAVTKVDAKSPVIAVFFGYKNATDGAHPFLATCIQDSTPIISCVRNLATATEELPASLLHINAFQLKKDSGSLERVVALILENLKLLRSERRLFISYRRSEAQSIAIQLYEKLDAAGFDVFLDTRSVPYGEDFQAVLWHRMADSDIVVLLDSPDFRSSHWTRAELSRANATNVQIVHLLWPTVSADPTSAFSDFMQLASNDFRSANHTGEQAHLKDTTTRRIVTRVESMRARALASRQRSLVDNFCDKARDEGARTVTVQPERYISVELACGKHLAVVPTIGIPRADRCHQTEQAILKTGISADVWLLYDDRGILDSWVAHLNWLNEHLPVTSVQVTQCVTKLREAAA